MWLEDEEEIGTGKLLKIADTIEDDMAVENGKRVECVNALIADAMKSDDPEYRKEAFELEADIMEIRKLSDDTLEDFRDEIKKKDKEDKEDKEAV